MQAEFLTNAIGVWSEPTDPFEVTGERIAEYAAATTSCRGDSSSARSVGTAGAGVPAKTSLNACPGRARRRRAG